MQGEGTQLRTVGEPRGYTRTKQRAGTHMGTGPFSPFWTSSLEADARARALELLLGGLGGLLGDLLQNGLGRALDELLGLLQAEAGDDLTHDLDDLDLLVARGLEDHVELVLLLG